jgi:hypothetical protein
VIFESGMDSDPVTMVLVPDSDLFEDETINHFSDDGSNDDDEDYDCDGRSNCVEEEVQSDDTEVNKVYGTVQHTHRLLVSLSHSGFGFCFKLMRLVSISYWTVV